MSLDRFRHQIENAGRRYRERAKQRAEKQREVDKIDRGELAAVNLDALDDRRRMRRRIAMNPTANESMARTVASATRGAVDARMVVLERIIKTDDLLSTAFLINGARVRRSVGRVAIRSSSGRIIGYGTGSMVSPRLMMTNNHVLASSSTAGNSTIQFDFVELFDGSQMTIVEYALAPNEFFVTDENLDMTLVAVSPVSTDGEQLASRGWSPFISESGKAIVGERVNIIQHPGGEPQQLALRQNRIVDVVGDFLHYEADTRRGSSGSPVANDAWQTAALHHAGVPKQDERDRILLQSGQVWDGGKDTLDQIAWIANEGARISRIVTKLQGLNSQLTAAKGRLLAQAFHPPKAGSVSLGEQDVKPLVPPDVDTPIGTAYSTPRIDDLGRAVFTLPIEITVGVPGVACSSSSVAAVPPDASADAAASGSSALPGSAPAGNATQPIDEDALQTARAALRAHESDAYYDEAADKADVETYYADIAEDASLVGKPLFNALHNLLQQTHRRVLSYKRARLEFLYPWVDLRPDRKLKSIYSGEPFDAEEMIRLDLEIAALHESMLASFMKTESAADPESLEAFLNDLEASSPFNCEHVVPQSWFGKRQPMKADLHHLFTCESGCNSFRSNIPYHQFPPVIEVDRPKCGRRETDERQFEPAAGKGPVARATLYFLIRYLGLVGDEASEMQSERLPTLLKWHADEPVTEYERHRNAAIRAAQGNRNPLIDFPEWAEHIDFGSGFGE